MLIQLFNWLPQMIYALVGIYFYFFFRRFMTLFSWKRKAWPVVLSVSGAILCAASCIRLYRFGTVLVLHILVVNLVMDVINILIRRSKSKEETRKKWSILYRSGILTFVLVLAWMGYGYWNIHQVSETIYEIQTEKPLKEEVEILQISDLHMGTTMDPDHLARLCEEMGKTPPDLVVLTGDIFDEHTSGEWMEQAAEILGRIPAKEGVYYVFGNHDYNRYVNHPAYTPKELEETLEKQGISVLADEQETLPCGVTLVGRKDASVPRKSAEELFQEVNPDSYVVMLDHHPVDGEINARLGVDLQLSGHTHAGQIFPMGQISYALGINEQNYGMETKGTFHRIVSSGMGGWGYPVRTGGCCEYVRVRIKEKGRS